MNLCKDCANIRQYPNKEYFCACDGLPVDPGKVVYTCFEEGINENKAPKTN
jgi:hypothetical protein